MEIPYIDGEYRILFKPEKYGDYVNDHCIVKGQGKYHLYGITSKTSNPYDERYFVHGVGDTLDEPLREVGVSINRGTLAWSPCVIEKDTYFYMFYGPSPTSMAVSPDMYEWFGSNIKIENEPLMAMHRDHFVMRLGEKYYMYVTGVKDRKGSIAVASSDDLINWQFEGYALTSGDAAPYKHGCGGMESPYVVKRGEWYYLFVTYTDCSPATYNDTYVFASRDPLHFGCYMGEEDEAVPITKIYAHAPEIIEENGEYQITTCGWRISPTPHKGCVSIAKLAWKQAE